jgi:DNA-binding NarL/FixJ family response regulator
LFREALRRGKEGELTPTITRLQTTLAEPLSTPSPIPSAAQPEQPLIEPLTEREREVLQLMAQGETNAEIAEQLVIALGTVKWYASQIYGKLDVSNRTEAAVRARELKLLQ